MSNDGGIAVRCYGLGNGVLFLCSAIAGDMRACTCPGAQGPYIQFTLGPNLKDNLRS